ncbi:MAG: tetratricopeptide repeat protein [Gammaproteobacteria bacterium]|nr:MAG: tetratricopeptide repeat protein [Gammaproteobacteria bacterium]
MTSSAEPVGSIEVALSHTARLLGSQPALAAEQASEVLKVAPGHPLATLLLGVARRGCGDPEAAARILEPLPAAHPNWALAHYEFGITLGALGQGQAAIGALRRALELKPDLAEAWLALAGHLSAIGDTAGADAAGARHIKCSTKDPRLLDAAAALCENRIPHAEALLREHLKERPTDVAAIRMLAEVAARLERYADAENLLARCLELAPGFSAARRNYAMVLHRQYKEVPALAQVEQLLARDPHDPTCRNLKAAILGGLGRYEESIQLYGGILAEYPQQEKVWLNYGHALKTAGRQEEGIAAYRRCITLAPRSGAAYWSLANLKTFRFEAADIGAMRAQLARPDLALDDRVQLHFALGKALEDEASYAESFQHYAEANRLRRAGSAYDPARTTARVERSRRILTREFFSDRRGYGADAADPIFIVGLPRAGSTLLEQILASHSAVEGTMELPDLISMARALAADARGTGPPYPALLAHLSASECRALGEQYIQRTRVQRRTQKPYFIDKMPNNFAYLGLIQLILPNARIIDARRHPLACCFSLFRQHFARGQEFAYDLDDLGRYYRDYIALMSHFDNILPQRVHRVIYERLIEDTETEVHRMLEYCGLPFEEGCLRFYENDRAVRTASSEQVRQPIFRDALEQWRHFEPWLGPLKAALGPVLAAYPGVPGF